MPLYRRKIRANDSTEHRLSSLLVCLVTKHPGRSNLKKEVWLWVWVLHGEEVLVPEAWAAGHMTSGVKQNVGHWCFSVVQDPKAGNGAFCFRAALAAVNQDAPSQSQGLMSRMTPIRLTTTGSQYTGHGLWSGSFCQRQTLWLWVAFSF